MQKPIKKNACFIWGLADFHKSEKDLSGVLKKGSINHLNYAAFPRK
jgi:hypothetical protein